MNGQVSYWLACSGMPQQMCCNATAAFMLLQALKRVA